MLSSCLPIHGATASTDNLPPEPTTATLAEPGFEFGKWVSYPGEEIYWRDCTEPEDQNAFECSTIQVPMDQFNHTSSDKVFTIPLIRNRGKDGSPNVLTNPGGPGESGVYWLRVMAQELRDIIGEDFHLLSFDPRGVGDSVPAMSLNFSEETCKLSKQKDPEGLRQSNDYSSAFATTYAKV